MPTSDSSLVQPPAKERVVKVKASKPKVLAIAGAILHIYNSKKNDSVQGTFHSSNSVQLEISNYAMVDGETITCKWYKSISNVYEHLPEKDGEFKISFPPNPNPSGKYRCDEIIKSTEPDGSITSKANGSYLFEIGNTSRPNVK